MRKTKRQIDMKIYVEVLACCDFTFHGTTNRNSNKLALRDSCLSINLMFSEEYAPRETRRIVYFHFNIYIFWKRYVYILKPNLSLSIFAQYSGWRETLDYDFSCFSPSYLRLTFFLCWTPGKRWNFRSVSCIAFHESMWFVLTKQRSHVRVAHISSSEKLETRFVNFANKFVLYLFWETFNKNLFLLKKEKTPTLLCLKAKGFYNFRSRSSAVFTFREIHSPRMEKWLRLFRRLFFLPRANV